MGRRHSSQRGFLRVIVFWCQLVRIAAWLPCCHSPATLRSLGASVGRPAQRERARYWGGITGDPRQAALFPCVELKMESVGAGRQESGADERTLRRARRRKRAGPTEVQRWDAMLDSLTSLVILLDLDNAADAVPLLEEVRGGAPTRRSARGGVDDFCVGVPLMVRGFAGVDYNGPKPDWLPINRCSALPTRASQPRWRTALTPARRAAAACARRTERTLFLRSTQDASSNNGRRATVRRVGGGHSRLRFSWCRPTLPWACVPAPPRRARAPRAPREAGAAPRGRLWPRRRAARALPRGSSARRWSLRRSSWRASSASARARALRAEAPSPRQSNARVLAIRARARSARSARGRRRRRGARPPAPRRSR